MTSTMSYQFPPPPNGGHEMELPQGSYMPVYALPSHPQPHPGAADPRTPHLPLQDLRDPGFGIRRSFSAHAGIPFPGGPIDQLQTASSGEKKRNKLGYHRTSVACVHCRRRKIRCVPDTNDVHNRCTNCIRLKKDCNFQPVDQQAPVETRSKSSIRGPGSQRTATASASPATSNGQTMPTMPNQLGLKGQDENGHTSPSDSGNITGQSFDFTNSSSIPPWGNEEHSPTSDAKDGPYAGYWASHAEGPPTNDSFPPYGHIIQTSPGWQGQQAGEQLAWNHMGVLTRSMSYSGEGLPSHQHVGLAHGSLSRRASALTGVPNQSMDASSPNVQPGAHRGFPAENMMQPDSGVWTMSETQAQMQSNSWGFGNQTN